MSGEFDLIRKYFTRPTPSAALGIGDDAALLALTLGHELAISADMLVAGTHFFADAAPYTIGWKSLAVNVSDMAAMGAKPRWATLAIALPDADENWVRHFAQGFFDCAERFQVELIGGDTTRGPLNISIQVMGEVPAGKALKRSGAKPGDDIWVSGPLGGAALGLHALQHKISLSDEELETSRYLLEQPQPRVALGLALREFASSAIDLSDGLLSDLGHILAASRCGADLRIDHIPVIEAVQKRMESLAIQQMVLAGGDDYELCFTAPGTHREQIRSIASQLDLTMAVIGQVVVGDSCIVRNKLDEIIPISHTGYDHFASI